VAVDELDDAGRLAERERTVDRLRPVERVEEPYPPVRGERMRRPGPGFLDHPAEAVGAEVVAEPHLHRGSVRMPVVRSPR
jgi:hypothetical protein